MKIIEEPSFQMEDSKGFDKMVEGEMETLEGGTSSCIHIEIGCIAQGTSKTTTTTKPSSGDITTTTAAVNPTALTIM